MLLGLLHRRSAFPAARQILRCQGLLRPHLYLYRPSALRRSPLSRGTVARFLLSLAIIFHRSHAQTLRTAYRYLCFCPTFLTHLLLCPCRGHSSHLSLRRRPPRRPAPSVVPLSNLPRCLDPSTVGLWWLPRHHSKTPPRFSFRLRPWPLLLPLRPQFLSFFALRSRQRTYRRRHAARRFCLAARRMSVFLHIRVWHRRRHAARRFCLAARRMSVFLHIRVWHRRRHAARQFCPRLPL